MTYDPNDQNKPFKGSLIEQFEVGCEKFGKVFEENFKCSSVKQVEEKFGNEIKMLEGKLQKNGCNKPYIQEGLEYFYESIKPQNITKTFEENAKQFELYKGIVDKAVCNLQLFLQGIHDCPLFCIIKVKQKIFELQHNDKLYKITVVISDDITSAENAWQHINCIKMQLGLNENPPFTEEFLQLGFVRILSGPEEIADHTEALQSNPVYSDFIIKYDDCCMLDGNYHHPESSYNLTQFTGKTFTFDGMLAMKLNALNDCFGFMKRFKDADFFVNNTLEMRHTLAA
ncbi:MAG: hypothetical protein ACTSXG_03690, partial [Alphaproteobacteria bacterium]